MEQLASRFNRCGLYANDAEHISNLAADLGEEGLQYLRTTVRAGPVRKPPEMVGLLSKLDPQAVEVFLPGRVKNFPRISQTRVVRQLSACGRAGPMPYPPQAARSRRSSVMPLVIDEIGVTADREALGRLMNIVDGDLPPSGRSCASRAAEALGRIHAPESVRRTQTHRGSQEVFGWAHPQELSHCRLCRPPDTGSHVGAGIPCQKRFESSGPSRSPPSQ